jgi:membrane fusion protein, multidrug efflux system
MKTSRIPSFASLIALAALPLAGPAGCARAGASERPAPTAAATPSAESAVAVTTAVVAQKPIARALVLTGTLTPNRRSDVAADANGKVIAAPIERGSIVAAGATLVRLDRRSAALTDEEARAQAASARTQQALADTECTRADKLFNAGAITQAEHDRAHTQCEASRSMAAAAAARARMASKSLGDAVVRAPFRGVVADRLVSEGEYVHADTRVATVVEIDPLRLELTVPEAAVGALARAKEVVFEVAAFPGESFQGRVRYVGPAVRRQSRDLLVEAVVANPQRRLLPGMFATARLVLGSEPRPVVPATAVKREAETDRVYVVANGHAEERLVALGLRDGDGFAVMSGLNTGDRVVAPIVAGLRDGISVAQQP